MTQHEEVIYLNNAASSWPKAPGVAEAVRATMENPPAHPGRTVATETDALTRCRQMLAAMLDVPHPERIVLTMHATQALNLALFGLGLEREALVVTTATEHNSVLRPLHHLQAESGIRLAVIGLDGAGRVDGDAFGAALQDQPALVAVNHVSNVTGQINDVAPLFAQAKGQGALTLLDASQSLGHIPVRPRELQADLVAFTGHKGLCGPQGTGGLYVAEHLELRQVYVGGTGVRSDLLLHPPDMPMRLEAGTPNVPAFAGLATALEWLKAHGGEHVAYEIELGAFLRSELGQIKGVRVLGAANDDKHLGIVSFVMPGWTPEDVGHILSDSYGILCRSGLHCAPLIHEALGCGPEGSVRLSVSGFTTPAEAQAAVTAVKAIAGAA